MVTRRTRILRCRLPDEVHHERSREERDRDVTADVRCRTLIVKGESNVKKQELKGLGM